MKGTTPPTMKITIEAMRCACACPWKPQTQASDPTTQTSAMGTRYFQHIDIIWSMRKRGRVQRSQMVTKTRLDALTKKTAKERTCSQNEASIRSGVMPGHGMRHPPRKSEVASAPMTHRFTHSAVAKAPKRKPEYSVL